jgi:hypothetical protein
MARIGEATTNATIASLRKMLSRLDSKLFESSSLPPVTAATLDTPRAA